VHEATAALLREKMAAAGIEVVPHSPPPETEADAAAAGAAESGRVTGGV
jgi:hypothetical protein